MLEKLPESLGRILHGEWSGMENIVFRQLLRHREVARIRVQSSAFDQMCAIPVQFTADGAGISPPLEWHRVPREAACVVLIVEDADSPTPLPLVHAILVAGGRDGSLEWGAMSSRWLPPDPPPDGAHRYAFQVFALSEGKAFSDALDRQELSDAIPERALAAGCLVGIYERLRRQKIDESDEAVGVPAAAPVMATA